MEYPDAQGAFDTARLITALGRKASSLGACGWVAEAPDRRVVGVAAACPPVDWISSIAGISDAHRRRLGRQLVEAEAIAVAEGYRGSRLGHRLLEQVRMHYQRVGYRLLTVTCSRKNSRLSDYYAQAGFTMLPLGEPLHLVDPLGVVLSRPVGPDMMRGWHPLHPAVEAVQIPGPQGPYVTALTGALAPPAGAPQVLAHGADGSATVDFDGQAVSVSAQMVRLVLAARAQAVSTSEIMAAVAEAAHYGLEPFVVAQLRKASGHPTLTSLFSR
ncbi:GNAT family N-acetyltransferase [Streptomyces sp. NPDC048638]|uniref:GNAT family N-acetyltransferase n=1 Tax=Streptomyces sp. NPDC048638 TaxID=3365580 RepID=UPI0037173A90